MAVSTSKRLSEVIRFWYQTRIANSVSTTPLNQLQDDYWNSLGLTGTSADRERQFYRKIITDNSQTPTNTRYASTLLKEALSALGVTPSVRFQENLMKLYITYNP